MVDVHYLDCTVHPHQKKNGARIPTGRIDHVIDGIKSLKCTYCKRAGAVAVRERAALSRKGGRDGELHDALPLLYGIVCKF